MKKAKGITLIALVVTIIVMLILVAVTVSYSIQSGLLSKAKEAKFRMEITTIKEKLDVQLINNAIATVLEEEKLPMEKVKLSDIENWKNELKIEIIYWGDYSTGLSTLNRSYIEKNYGYIISESNNSDTYLDNMYYIDENIAGESHAYIYDSNTDVIYKIKQTKIGKYKVHSIEELDYEKSGGTIDRELLLRKKISQESNIINVNGLKYYEPDLNGFVEKNTKAVYYKTITNTDETKTIDSAKVEFEISDYLSTKSINPSNEQYKDYEFFDYANNKWANIVVEDNNIKSYWVWIPRYAYELSGSNTDIRFIDNNNIDLITGNPIDTTKYIVHPDFVQQDENGNTIQLKGIWVSKYEMSETINTTTAAEYYIPDLSNFNPESTYIEVYNGSNGFNEKKLSEIKDLQSFVKNNKWYDYENKIWANIKTVYEDSQTHEKVESWWVWIPRYAYNITGEIISIIFIDTNNNPLDGSTLPNNYIIHPDFEQKDESENTIQLKGIWVSKYEMSTTTPIK